MGCGGSKTYSLTVQKICLARVAERLSIQIAGAFPEEVRRSDLCFGEVIPAACAFVASEG